MLKAAHDMDVRLRFNVRLFCVAIPPAAVLTQRFSNLLEIRQVHGEFNVFFSLQLFLQIHQRKLAALL